MEVKMYLFLKISLRKRVRLEHQIQNYTQLQHHISQVKV